MINITISVTSNNDKPNTHNKINKGHIDPNTVSGVRSGLSFTWNVCLFILKCEANVGSQYLGTTVSKNPLTRLEYSLLFWTASSVTVTWSVFCSINHIFIPVSSGSENSSKTTQRMALSAAIVATVASSEQAVQCITVSIKKKTFCTVFFKAEHSTDLI